MNPEYFATWGHLDLTRHQNYGPQCFFWHHQACLPFVNWISSHGGNALGFPICTYACVCQCMLTYANVCLCMYICVSLCIYIYHLYDHESICT